MCSKLLALGFAGHSATQLFSFPKTSYSIQLLLNQLAPSQITNAKKAGLTVSTYHFSWFENQQEAIDQANYYADYAEELGLSQNSVMVNDAETAPMINADATKVSVYFRDQLVKRGFKNVVHYSSASGFL